MQEGKKESGGGHIVAEVRKEVLKLVEQAAAQLGAHRAEGGEIGLQVAHERELRAARPVENTEDAKPERVSADQKIAHQPGGHHGGVDEEDEQAADGARTEPGEDEGKEAEEHPRGQRLGEGHEAEEQGRPGKGEKGAPGQFVFPRHHGATGQPQGRTEEEEQEHLRQPGNGKPPEQVGEQNESGGQPGDAQVKEAPHQKEGDQDRSEEEQYAGCGNHCVAKIDDISRLHRPPTFDRPEEGGVEDGIEGKIVDVRLGGRGDLLAVVEELPQGERTDVERGVARTRGDLPSDLGLIHGSLGIQTAEDD